MALVKCKDCGGDVSTDAYKCARCGALARKRLNKVGLAIVILVVAIPVTAAILFADTLWDAM